MKGHLYKTDQGWVVEYAKHAELPLHPDDVKQINADAQVFDNIEARIAAYPEVEFEIRHLSVDPLGRDVKPYAKLVDKLGNEDVPKLGYDERKQNLIDIMNEDAKDGLYDVRKMVEDDATPIDWLINQLENHIVLSAHGKLGTNRTGDYRIGLRKAIDFCHEAKERIPDNGKMVDDDILIPMVPNVQCRDGKEIGVWMKGWEEGFIEAKSTLYTEEQMVDLLKFVIESKSGLTSEEFRKASYSFMVKKFIQSLKQPKKD